MQLIDLLSVIYDWGSTEVYVHDNEGNVIACYDGKDSIPNFLKGKTVTGVYAKNNRIEIDIDYYKGKEN